MFDLLSKKKKSQYLLKTTLSNSFYSKNEEHLIYIDIIRNYKVNDRSRFSNAILLWATCPGFISQIHDMLYRFIMYMTGYGM